MPQIRLLSILIFSLIQTKDDNVKLENIFWSSIEGIFVRKDRIIMHMDDQNDDPKNPSQHAAFFAATAALSAKNIKPETSREFVFMIEDYAQEDPDEENNINPKNYEFDEIGNFITYTIYYTHSWNA